MQTLEAHQAPGDDNAVHVAVTHEARRQAAALAVQDAITRLDDALRLAGHTPGSWGIVLANGDCLINQPVIESAARGLIRRGALSVNE